MAGTLRSAHVIELFYMLLVRFENQWRFVLVPREALATHRERFELSQRSGKGRKPKSADAAKTNALALDLTIVGADALMWGQSFLHDIDRWPDELAPIEAGPGTRKVT